MMLDDRKNVVSRTLSPEPNIRPKAAVRCEGRTRGPASVALTLFLSLSIAGCQTDATRDSGGAIVQLSDWQEIQHYEADLNIPLAINRIRKVEKRIRDNSVVHNRVYFDFDRGIYFSERLYDGFFGETSHMKLTDFDRFVSYVKKDLGDYYVGHETPQKVTHPRYTSGGFVTTADIFGGKKCIVARTGYKFSEPSYDNDPGTFDTVVFFRYCDFDARLDAILPILQGVEVVEDRSEFRAALDERRAAMKESNSSTSSESADTYVTCRSRFGLVSTMKEQVCRSFGGQVVR